MPDPQQPAAQPQGLLRVLLDRSAPLGDRDDAAMDLGAFDEPVVEAALASVVLDRADDEVVIESAAESLAQIWARKGTWDAKLVEHAHPCAQAFFRKPAPNS